MLSLGITDGNEQVLVITTELEQGAARVSMEEALTLPHIDLVVLEDLRGMIRGWATASEFFSRKNLLDYRGHENYFMRPDRMRKEGM